MDAFAVAVAGSVVIGKVNGRQIFRFAFHFGLFQALMPILGWFAGSTARNYIEAWDHWIAFVLLAAIGAKAIYESLKSNGNGKMNGDPTRGMSLVLYSIATSIDALAVGVSLALLGTEIFYPAIIIGVITAIVTTIGMVFGSSIGKILGRADRNYWRGYSYRYWNKDTS